MEYGGWIWVNSAKFNGRSFSRSRFVTCYQTDRQAAFLQLQLRTHQKISLCAFLWLFNAIISNISQFLLLKLQSLELHNVLSYHSLAVIALSLQKNTTVLKYVTHPLIHIPVHSLKTQFNFTAWQAKYSVDCGSK